MTRRKPGRLGVARKRRGKKKSKQAAAPAAANARRDPPESPEASSTPPAAEAVTKPAQDTSQADAPAPADPLSAGLASGRRLWRKIAAVAAAVLTICIIASAIQPETFVQAGDTESSKNVTAEGLAHAQETGSDLLWSRRIFGGMPYYAAMFYHHTSNGLVWVMLKTKVFFGRGTYYTFGFVLAGVCLLYLCLSLGTRVLPALAAALAFAIQPAVSVLAPAAHGSKLYSYALYPVIFVLALQLARKGGWLRLAAFSYVLYLWIVQNHPQMALYGVGVTVFVLVVWGVREIRQKAWKKVAAAVGKLSLASLVAVLLAAALWLPTYDYMKHSIRGQGPMPTPEQARETSESGALDWTYATNWSLHPVETVTFVVPEAFGFGGGGYFGWMNFTLQPHYLGVVALVLACFAFLDAQDRKLAIPLAVCASLAVLVSFGRFWDYGPYKLLYDYMPGFNRIRVPSMALFGTSFCVSVLAGLGGNRIAATLGQGSKAIKGLARKLAIGAGIAVGFYLLLGFGGIVSGAVRERYFEQRLVEYARQDASVYERVVLLAPEWAAALGRVDKLEQVDSATAGSLQSVRLNLPIGGQRQLIPAASIAASLFPEAQAAAKLASEDFALSLFYALLTLGACFGACALVLVFGADAHKIVAGILGVVLVALVFLDLQRTNDKVMAEQPHDDIFQIAPAGLPRDLAYLVELAETELANPPVEPFRIWPYAGYEEPNYFPGTGLESIEGYSPFKLRQYQNLRDLVSDGTRYARVPQLPNMLNARYIRSASAGPPPGFKTRLVFEDVQVLQQYYAGALQMTTQRGERVRLAPRLSVSILQQQEQKLKIAVQRQSGQADTGWVDLDRIGLVQIYENLDAQPRAWFCNELIEVTSEKAARDRLRGFDPARQAIVVGSVGELPAGTAQGSIEINAYENRLTGLDVQTDRKTLLVLSEMDYIHWKLFVDGEPRETLRVNYLLRGVVLEAGKHRVEWRYDDSVYQTSQFLTGSATVVLWLFILLGIGQLALPWWRGRKPAAEAGPKTGGS